MPVPRRGGSPPPPLPQPTSSVFSASLSASSSFEANVDDDGESREPTTKQPKIVYSQHSPPTPSIHPSWEHLDERISVEDCDDWWNQNELYKSMRVKLSVVSNAGEDASEPDCEPEGTGEDCVLEALLHPSFLERIDLGRNSSNSNNNNDNSIDENTDRNSLLPPGLPPNAMLVHFSDGSIRCCKHTYQILWDNYGQMLEPPPVEDFSRFEDDAFATLDHVEQTPQRPRNRSVSSLLDQDQGYVSSANEEGKSSSPLGKRRMPLHPSMSPRRMFQPHDNDSLWIDEQAIVREERRQEKLELLRLIAEEEKGLEDDLDCLKEEQQTLTNLMEQVKLVEKDISKVKVQLDKQSLKLEKEEILKESQSIKLLRDLRDIYPIALDSLPTPGPPEGSTDCFIRGLRLPADIYTTNVPEEEVNTSLGYCAHLVVMVAKYCSVQLRHRIFCNGSRSAIELDEVGIFPLFLGRLAARALEREQVDRGARLLGSNVDCILMHLNLVPQPQSHILARVQTILEFVAEGKR